jgi:signal transduction histidine kinase
VKQLGGSVEIGNNPDGGARVTADIPLQEAA